MPTASWLPRLFLFLALSLPRLAAADSVPLADLEGNLLHRRVALSGVKRWDRRSRQWISYKPTPKSKLYVINIWSVHCKPCVDEFPRLRRVASAWRSDPRVDFLFIADPPDENGETEFAAFWTEHAAAVPDYDPLRSADPVLQKSIDIDARPVTLLVDNNLIVRQAFVGSIALRNLGTAIERLLGALAHEK